MNDAGHAGGYDGGTMDIDALWAAFHERVHHWLVRMVGTAGDPDDLTICVFVRAWHRRDRYDATQGSVCTWLYTITHNIAYSFLRKKRLRMESLEGLSLRREPTCVGPAEEHEAAEAQARLWRAVDALPDRERVVMRLHFQEGLTWGEVAQRLSISLRDVMYHAARGLELLREKLRRQ